MAQDSAARCSRSLTCSTRSWERCNLGNRRSANKNGAEFGAILLRENFRLLPGLRLPIRQQGERSGSIFARKGIDKEALAIVRYVILEDGIASGVHARTEQRVRRGSDQLAAFGLDGDRHQLFADADVVELLPVGTP